MLTLGIDTSNYATSMALVQSTGQEVVCALKRFLPVKEGATGLRQSDALFHHTAALPAMLEELREKAELKSVAAVGVSAKPRPVEGSYMPCFLAGTTFASAFAAGAGAKLCTTTHQQGHLAAALYGAGIEPGRHGQLLMFHASGGTTELLLTSGYAVNDKLGESLDLYAGQAVDRLGVRLGFAFPAGAEVSALAAQCDEEPDPRVSVKGCNCHLSGLQNQCDALLEEGKTAAYVAKYCLTAIAKTVYGMVTAARRQLGNVPLLCAGGVMSSEVIRRYLAGRLETVHFAPAEYSADNAIGVALIAAKEAEHG